MSFKYFVNKGFSLIELLVAVAILGILTSISTVFYKSYVEKANLSLVESVLRSAYGIVKDNQNFGVSTSNVELNSMSTPEEQNTKAKQNNPTTTIGTWVMKLDTSLVTSIPVGTTQNWCLQINLGDIAYKRSSSCIDSSTGKMAHKGQPLPTSKGECNASSQCE
ncbi:MAG: prepilin-type N-terminal cleavage/methylation domain-containing protein [Oligoflexia bacterium]|nr:prepilin-type N-terminal cleavage/methylation domain-containing protein [Oligoflexia bacterium]